MNYREIARRFDQEGFVLIPGFLNDEECSTINQAITQHYAVIDVSPQAAVHREAEFIQPFECDVIPWDPISEGIEAFTAIKQKQSMAKLTRACVGDGFSENSSLVMYSCRGGRGQSWHQDCLPDSSLGYNVNRLVYGRDVQEGDGAVVVVPGSHRWGRIPDGGHHETIDGELTLYPEAGTLVLLHGWCYHRVLPNTSGNERVSINFRCFPRGVDRGVTSVGVYRNGDAYFSQKQSKMRVS